MKWYTQIEVLDIETGEIHEKNINMNDWIKVKKTEKYEINEHETKGIKKITYECRKRDEQLEIEFDFN